MSKVDEKLDELLDIQGEIVEVEKNLPVIHSEPRGEEQNSDYKYSRENFYSLIERGQDAIDGILDLAKEGEHPRAYEVAGQLIKTQSEIAQNLLDLQDKLKKIKDVKELGPKNVTNALFVGSTTELQKMIKKNKDKK